MNKNQILSEIVASAEQDLGKTASTNMQTENPEARNHIPTEQPKSLIEKLKQRTTYGPSYTDDYQEINYQDEGPNKVANMQTPNLSIDKPTQIVKMASGEQVLQALQQTSGNLKKIASYEQEELDMYLEKVAMETLEDTQQLEKIAEHFGDLAAEAFLRNFQ